jgi:hypothetical protein
MSSDIQLKDAKQALAEDKFDDCMSCRVTGKYTLLHSPGIVSLLIYCHRVCCIRWPWCLQLLYRNGQPSKTRKGHHARPDQIQNGITPAGNRHNICDISGNGAVAGIQLNALQSSETEGLWHTRLEWTKCGSGEHELKSCKILNCYLIAANDSCHSGYRVSPQAYPSICYMTRVRKNKIIKTKDRKESHEKRHKKEKKSKKKNQNDMQTSFPCYAPEKRHLRTRKSHPATA